MVHLDLRMLDPLHDAVEAEDDRELAGRTSRSRAGERPRLCDAPRQRVAVEAVEPQRLGRRAERRPAFDTADRHLAAGQLTAQRVAERADRRVVLDDDDRRRRSR